MMLEPHKKQSNSLENLFTEIERLNKKTHILLVFDEFQDIHTVKGMDAKFRTYFQNLPSKFPIVVMGSKKHLLAHLFSLPKAPLAGWGIDYEISKITPKDFLPYLNKRFNKHGKKILLHEVEYLCDRLQNIPESIMYVCKTLSQESDIKQIQPIDIERAIKKTVSMRRGRFEESLQYFSAYERKFLKMLALHEPLQALTSKMFLTETQISSAGVLKIMRKLENLGLIYHLETGWVLTDPLLAKYIQDFWF